VQLYKLKLGETVSTVPTIGFNVETIKYKRMNMTAWDVGGQEKLRRLWHHYLEGSESLIYLVDSADRSRFEEAAEELRRVLEAPGMSGCRNVLVFANKQDLPDAAGAEEVAAALQVASVAGPGRKWWVQGCVSTTGDGLYDGLDWLATQICSRKD
jgi:small GTP-binding protein